VDVVSQAEREFVKGCIDLEKVMSMRFPDICRVEKLKQECDNLEAYLVMKLQLSAPLRLELWGKTNFIVRKRLRMREIERRRPRSDIYRKQTERLESIQSTYERFSPKQEYRERSETISCPHDEGFYRINRLTDELLVSRTLPGNQFHLEGLGLTDSHLSHLCRRCHFDLARICKLDLGNNQLTDANLIAKLILESRNLLFVNLRGNKINIDGLLVLIRTIVRKYEFIGIDLTRNSLEPSAVRGYLLLELESVPPQSRAERIDALKLAYEKILIDKQTTCMSMLKSYT
jgi:hypothetical protein